MDNYSELLQKQEWQIKRSEILKRDNNCCVNCLNKAIILSSYFTKFSFRPYKGKVIIHAKILDINKSYKDIIDIEFNRIFELVIQKKQAFCSISLIDNILYLNGICEHTLIQDLKLTEKHIINNLNKLNWIFVPGLHVHHSYYKLELKPWDYPDDSLDTLCWICHKELHENRKVPVLNYDNAQIGYYEPCNRCYGAGYFPQFRHINSGICFRCSGAKYEELIQRQY